MHCGQSRRGGKRWNRRQVKWEEAGQRAGRGRAEGRESGKRQANGQAEVEQKAGKEGRGRATHRKRWNRRQGKWEEAGQVQGAGTSSAEDRGRGRPSAGGRHPPSTKLQTPGTPSVGLSTPRCTPGVQGLRQRAVVADPHMCRPGAAFVGKGCCLEQHLWEPGRSACCAACRTAAAVHLRARALHQVYCSPVAARLALPFKHAPASTGLEASSLLICPRQHWTQGLLAPMARYTHTPTN